MKKLLILTLSLTLLNSCDESQNTSSNTHSNSYDNTEVLDTNTTLPNSLVVQAEFLTIGTDMDLYDTEDNYYGVVEERTFNLTRTFEYYDKNDKLIAKAKQRFLSWGTVIDINDEQGNSIGTIEQQVFDSFFSLYSKYKIYDANHKQLATSDKLDFFTSNVYIEGSTSNVKLHQESLTLVDTWDVYINGDIDKRLIVFIPAFISAAQTDRQNEK